MRLSWRPTVTLTESMISWNTVKYATDAENGIVNGSLDKKTIVDRRFKTRVLKSLSEGNARA